MDFGILFKRVGQVAAENTPAILTAIGVTGTVATAYLAAKAGYESVEPLREAEEKKQDEFHGETDEGVISGDLVDVQCEPLTAMEKAEVVWKLYVPAATTAAVTITSILFAARVSDRRNAALAAAYSVVEKSYSEYRTENVKKLGKKKEQELRDAIAQAKADRSPVTRSAIVVSKRGGGTLCYDSWTDRWFTSDLETIRKAVNDFNVQVINQTYMSLSEFYHLLGLPVTRESDNIGWSTDKILEIDFSGIIDEHGEPAISVDFKTMPNARFASSY